MKFRYEGAVYKMVERPLFAEIDWVETNAKRGLDDMSNALRTGALSLITLRRAGVMLTWADVLKMSPADFEKVDDPDDPDEPDPQAAGAEAGSQSSPDLSPSDATGTGS